MLLPALIALSALTPPTLDGTWTGVLDSPGGPLRFGVELGGDLQAVVVNGPERIEVPTASFEGGSLLLRFDHYDSEIRATLGEEGTFAGEWTKVGARGKLTTMPFEMTRPARRGSFSLERADWHRERHAVDFESSDDSAVLLLETEPRPAPGEPARALATFMTTTGDYRYLAGTLDDARLTLSVFDGAHAFLFIAERDDAGGFSGDFWSRDTWHETWTSRPDPDAALPDAFAETTWTGDASLDELVFRDLEGAPVSVASLRAPGQPMVLKVFGSWCPNCHDEAAMLVELYRRYRERGLRILGLAFGKRDVRLARHMTDEWRDWARAAGFRSFKAQRQW